MDVTGLLAAHDPNAVAVICEAASRTWSELIGAIEARAAALASRREIASHPTGSGGPPPIVAVHGPTSIEFLEIVLGTLQAGLTVMPLDPRLPVDELADAVGRVAPALIVSVEPNPGAVPARGGSTAAEVAVEAGVAHVDAGALDRAGTGPLATPPNSRHHSAETPAVLLLTSGTSGAPNVVVLTARNVEAGIGQALAGAAGVADRASVILGVMPLTHVLGLVSVVGVALTIGASLVLVPQPGVEQVVAAIEANQVTVIVAPPVFWFRLAESEVGPDRLASVSIAISGAAPLGGRLARRVEDRFGLVLRQGYGLTEASPGLSSAIGTDAPATSVGRPLPGVELRLVDEFGDDALVGDVGEVWARGPNIFAGYLGDPDATRAVLDDDGWLHTGDLAVVDESGFLYIVGRSKDQIIVAGFNVHPEQVEQHLLAHPGVAGAAVVGEPDQEYGEVVVAWIVATDAPPTIEALDRHCRDSLAGYKVPRRYEFVEELPRGFNGKLRRRVLRRPAG